MIESSMFSCGVCDGQRSSLIVQLQSVSESPIKNIIIYGDVLGNSIKCSYERVFIFKHPQYLIIYISKISV
ncbi:hypothetical protein PO909_028306 [Leuciscus waleckii]